MRLTGRIWWRLGRRRHSRCNHNLRVVVDRGRHILDQRRSGLLALLALRRARWSRCGYLRNLVRHDCMRGRLLGHRNRSRERHDCGRAILCPRRGGLLALLALRRERWLWCGHLCDLVRHARGRLLGHRDRSRQRRNCRILLGSIHDDRRRVRSWRMRGHGGGDGRCKLGRGCLAALADSGRGRHREHRRHRLRGRRHDILLSQRLGALDA